MGNKALTGMGLRRRKAFGHFKGRATGARLVGTLYGDSGKVIGVG